MNSAALLHYALALFCGYCAGEQIKAKRWPLLGIYVVLLVYSLVHAVVLNLK